MRMQTEVPSSLESHKGRFATNPTRTFLADALKADRNHRITFCGPRGSYEIVRAISFNAGTHKCDRPLRLCAFAGDLRLSRLWRARRWRR